MRWEDAAYCVGLLKAAEFHGATHQAVLPFQVVCGKRLREIRAGRNVIVLYFRKAMEHPLAGIEDKTDTGTMKGLIRLVDRLGPASLSAGVRRDRQHSHGRRGPCARDRAPRAGGAVDQGRADGRATAWLPAGLGSARIV